MQQEKRTGHRRCGIPDCGDQSEHRHLARYDFRLPDVIGVRDGFRSLQTYGPSSEERDGTFAHVTVRQVELATDDSTALSIRSIFGASGQDADELQGGPARPQQLHSVAEVITFAHSPDDPPAGWDGRVENLGPLEDALVRAIHAARTVARSVRLADHGRAPLLPTYERAPAMVLMRQTTITEPLSLDEFTTIKWGSSSIVLLDHRNWPGYRPEPVPEEDAAEWGVRIGLGMPAVLARERFIEARRLLHQEGEYAAAVVSAVTAVEILCDSILSALLWEECIESAEQDWKVAMADAVTQFSGGMTPLKRASTFTQQRLGGDWTSQASPWQLFRDGAASIRNRIVHAGYEPRRQEALEAIQHAFDAQSFLLSRLAAQRSKFPRSIFLLVGRAGMEARGAYSGKIKHFFEEVAVNEPDYAVNFSAWHRSLVGNVSE